MNVEGSDIEKSLRKKQRTAELRGVLQAVLSRLGIQEGFYSLFARRGAASRVAVHVVNLMPTAGDVRARVKRPDADD
jgi:hypothetical protein